MKLNVYTLTILLICFIDRGQFSHLNKRDLFGTKPPGTACTFNACNFHNNCSDTQDCITDSDCRPKCICAAGFTGNLCDVELDDLLVTTEPNRTESSTPVITSTVTTETPLDACSSTYSLRPFQERFCFGLICKYGKCDKTPTDNGVEFKCVCDTGADGNICEYQCCKDCGENGRCEVNATGIEYCNCDSIKYFGDFCNLTRSNATYVTNYTDTTTTYVTEDWYLWVVGSCSLVLVILLGTLIIFPYYLWKKRITFMMKVVYYFQPYEDNDERKWDAFVSYKSGGDDENFVIRKLRPMLEDEIGFKLCLHFRDFLPGETIANNILRAVNGSRRTILLLTPRYVESEWTQFEYQIAQELTLQRKHRIIPVVLSDISPVMETMDKNLKHIIKSITYLEWSDDGNEKKINNFWNKLKLSLPKRKSLEQKENQKENKLPDKENVSESNIDYHQLNSLEKDKNHEPHTLTCAPNISHHDVVLDMFSNPKQNTAISDVSDELNTNVDLEKDIFSIKL